ncbi:MAG: phosphoribosyl-ATP diphosphatase [Deltaproteobacteria bacterium]|nr:phosphoribosyl-ATP diphosphatase [Deltaproteobacteria bacterium]
MIVPSIDLMGGRAVQLRRGRTKVLERRDVLGLARRFRTYGPIAVIDLDAALGRGDNLALIRRICAEAECRVGGGIRTVERAREVLAAGAAQLIVGTKAERSFLAQLPKDRVIVAVDAVRGTVVDRGWRRRTRATPEARARELSPYCAGFLFTVVEREGGLGGTDLDAIRRVRAATELPLTAAGGITTEEEILRLDRLGIDAQVGMAIYTGKLDLPSAFAALIDFGKDPRGLVPTVVVDERGNVLTLAYSSRRSLVRALRTRRGVYESRSRGRIWVKGETSGHVQELRRVEADCDRDALVFVVRQTGVACHTGSYSCFGTGRPRFETGLLYDTLRSRIAEGGEESYTVRLARSPRLLRRKVMEEAYELVEAVTGEERVHEAADLVYHTLALLAAEGVGWDEVLRRLEARRR